MYLLSHLNFDGSVEHIHPKVIVIHIMKREMDQLKKYIPIHIV